jgi:hypothetical protein
MLLGLVIVTGVVQAADVRTWTDRAGRQFEGELVGFIDGQVQIKRTSDGQAAVAVIGDLLAGMPRANFCPVSRVDPALRCYRMFRRTITIEAIS